MRRGQLQTLEPVIIVIVLTVLLLAGGAYFLRASQDDESRRAASVSARDDLALLERLSSLPELACSGPASANRMCVDLAKAEAFAGIIAGDETLRVAYFPILGATNLTLRVLDIDEGSSRAMALYDASRNGTRTRATRTYVTVLDPATGDVRFGMLEIRRSIG